MLEYQLTIGERQKSDASHRLVEILLVTLEQQYIAGLEADIAQPAVDRAALPGQSKQVDLPVTPELEGRRGPTLDPRGRLDHGLGDRQLLCGGAFLGLGLALGVEIGRAHV